MNKKAALKSEPREKRKRGKTPRVARLQIGDVVIWAILATSKPIR